MTVEEAIKLRKSVRSYLPRPVEKEKILELFKAARLAPSASNRQEWRFVAVTRDETRRMLAQAALGQSFVYQAPCVIVCCADTDFHVMTCGQACYPIDVAIAIDHMTLRAVELGLGTCWVGAFNEGEVKQTINIPERIRVVELLTVGYTNDQTLKPKNRLPLDKISFFEEWGNRMQL